MKAIKFKKISNCAEFVSWSYNILMNFLKKMSLSCLFASFGEHIARCSLSFVAFSLMWASLAIVGLWHAEIEMSSDHLFVPEEAAGFKERDIVNEYFLLDENNYEFGHQTRSLSLGVQIIVQSLNGTNMLRPEVFQDLLELDKIVRSKMGYTKNNRTYTYQNLCVRKLEKCYENNVLTLNDYMDRIQKGIVELKYPFTQNPLDQDKYFFPLNFGGMTIGENGTITMVKAIRLIYPLKSRGENDNSPLLQQLWENAVMQLQNKLQFEHIKTKFIVSQAIEQGLFENINTAIDYFPAGIMLLVAFSTFNCMAWYINESRVLVGLCGILNTVLATGAAWGILAHIFKVPWQSINVASLFLMLGVGLDDTYVMLASYKRASAIHPDVAMRMRLCYEEAAVSITVTSLTNFASFAVGCSSTFPCVKYFCIYCAVGILSIFFYNLIFFGPCLAISCCFEKYMLRKCWLYERCSKEQTYVTIMNNNANADNENLVGSLPSDQIGFFDGLGVLLMKPKVKILVLSVFVSYLAVSSYFITQVNEGLQRRQLALDDSPVVEFYNLEDEYFRKNPYRFQIVVVGKLKYWEKSVQEKVFKLLNNFTLSNYVSDNTDFEENWLKEFLDYTTKRGFQIADEKNFVSELRSFLVEVRNTPLAKDVRFEVREDQSVEITATRFLLQSSDIPNAAEEAKMTRNLRLIAEQSGLGNVTVFHHYFPFFDQFLGILPNTLNNLGIGCVVVLLVTAVLLKNCTSVLWVTFCVASVELGVFGFMVAWDINLDVISMISLIMCLGFSVDFSAHIANHFVRSKAKDNNSKVMECLNMYGLSIFQSAASSILAVLVLLFIPSYILNSFAKMMILVITDGAVHGLIFLPVFLSLPQPRFRKSAAAPVAEISGIEEIQLDEFQDVELDQEDPFIPQEQNQEEQPIQEEQVQNAVVAEVHENRTEEDENGVEYI